MSKLTHVREALQGNATITIVGAPEQNYLPGRNGYWSHTVDFYVAPKVGGLYTAKELQVLMKSLVPGLEPTCMDNFFDRDLEMAFGKLYFDEVIGAEAICREIVLSDEDVFFSDGFIDGKRIINCTQELWRRTWVNLFPNVQIATSALSGENKFRISKRELTKYRGFLARLANSLV